VRRLVLLLLVLTTACGSADSTGQTLDPPAGTAGPAASSAAGPSVSASATEDARAAVLAGYSAYWIALLHAHATGDPADPQLRAHATGTALAEAAGGIRANTARGIRMKGAVTHKPVVSAVSGTTATVADCVDLRSWLAYDVPSGRRDPSIRPIGRVAGTYTLTGSGRAWRVSAAVQGAFC
jgi:hypothetical protein